MKTKTLLAALAVSSLALAQPAYASAATRSYESLPQAGAKVSHTARTGSRVKKNEGIVLALLPIIAAVGVAAAVAAFVVIPAVSNQSSG